GAPAIPGCCVLVAWGRGRLLSASLIARVGLVVDRAILAGVGEVVGGAVLVLHRLVGVVGAEVGPLAPAGAVVAGVVGVTIFGRVHRVLLLVVDVGARLVRDLRGRCRRVGGPAAPALALGEGVVVRG